jgi:hypothetical protein
MAICILEILFAILLAGVAKRMLDLVF